MAEQLGKHGATTVFVSYAHESADFRARVKQLCDFEHAVKASPELAGTVFEWAGGGSGVDQDRSGAPQMNPWEQ